MAKRRTKEENLTRLAWNIDDARKALRAAESMENWRGVIKYAQQIIRLDHQMVQASRMGLKRTRRERVMNVGKSAGDVYGTGFGAEYKPGWKAAHYGVERDVTAPRPTHARLYHIVAINERTGHKEYLSIVPMVHQEATTMLSKFFPRPKGAPSHVRLQLEEAG